jgi:hypothetical protein
MLTSILNLHHGADVLYNSLQTSRQSYNHTGRFHPFFFRRRYAIIYSLHEGLGSMTEVKWLGKDLCPYKWSGVKLLSEGIGIDGKDPGESQCTSHFGYSFTLFPHFNQVTLSGEDL